MFEEIVNAVATEFSIPVDSLIAEGMYRDKWSNAWCCKFSLPQDEHKRFFLGERFDNGNIYVKEIAALNRNN